jgi:hypothetical protein
VSRRRLTLEDDLLEAIHEDEVVSTIVDFQARDESVDELSLA